MMIKATQAIFMDTRPAAKQFYLLIENYRTTLQCNETLPKHRFLNRVKQTVKDSEAKHQFLNVAQQTSFLSIGRAKSTITIHF